MLLILLILSADGSLARADEGTVTFTDKGKVLASKGDFHGALAMFKQALSLSPGAKEQCNVAGAYYKLRRWSEADLYLGLCLQGAATETAEDRNFIKVMRSVQVKVRDHVRKGEFGLVRFEPTPTSAKLQVSALSGDIRFGAGQNIWLPTGTHRVSASAQEYVSAEREFVVTKGESSTVLIELDEYNPPDNSISKPGDAGTSTADTLIPSPDSTIYDGEQASPVLGNSSAASGQNTGTSKLAIGTLALAATSLATGSLFYFLASDSADQAQGLTALDSRRSDLRDQFDTRRIVSYSLLGAGAIAAAVGTYWLLKKTEANSTVVVGPHLSENSAGVFGYWSF